MTPTTRLCNIALKPGISASTQLITTRRICRNIISHLDTIVAERKAIRRQAAKLKTWSKKHASTRSKPVAGHETRWWGLGVH
jgi:hypothetical protein